MAGLNTAKGPKSEDRMTNSVDLDQTAPKGPVWSGTTLFAILSSIFGLCRIEKQICLNFKKSTPIPSF